jgi:hypothetical protein
MRLTPDLINKSLSYLNPLNERELDLRGALPTEKNRYYTMSSIDVHTLFLNPQAIKSPR